MAVPYVKRAHVAFHVYALGTDSEDVKAHAQSFNEKCQIVLLCARIGVTKKYYCCFGIPKTLTLR